MWHSGVSSRHDHSLVGPELDSEKYSEKKWPAVEGAVGGQQQKNNNYNNKNKPTTAVFLLHLAPEFCTATGTKFATGKKRKQAIFMVQRK